MEKIILTIIILNAFSKLFLNKVILEVPIENPIPKMGPITGDSIMAPITALFELIFNPIQAIRIAKAKSHKFLPLNSTPSLISR